MSELATVRNRGREFRWQLLSSVSVLAVLAVVYGPTKSEAADQDGDRPTVWIELGGQLERVSGQGGAFAPAFVAANSGSPVLTPVSPIQAQNPVPFSFAEDGKVSLQPQGSNWVFSAAVKFGRSSNFKHVDHQTDGSFYNTYKSGVPRTIQGKLYPNVTSEEFADTQVHHSESHAVIDFSVGKDVGFGMFGQDGTSLLNLGVRFAQFESRATFDVRARPDLQKHYLTAGKYKIVQAYFHSYHATGQASRSFHGIGPSLSWDGSAPFVDTPNGAMTFDWGVNAAFLFGRQKTRAQHQESAQYLPPAFNRNLQSDYHHSPAGHDVARSTIVPNVGGFAGASYRIQNFKASFGYRADFFFGAIDGGIDTRKSETLGFYGPFASVSVGLGG